MKYFLMLLFFFLGCAIARIPLRLQDRTLLIDPLDVGMLIYPLTLEDCKYPSRRFFRFCKNRRKVIQYDLKDPVVRDKLINAGFRCQSPMRFKY